MTKTCPCGAEIKGKPKQYHLRKGEESISVTDVCMKCYWDAWRAGEKLMAEDE